MVRAVRAYGKAAITGARSSTSSSPTRPLERYPEQAHRLFPDLGDIACSRGSPPVGRSCRGSPPWPCRSPDPRRRPRSRHAPPRRQIQSRRGTTRSVVSTRTRSYSTAVTPASSSDAITVSTGRQPRQVGSVTTSALRMPRSRRPFPPLAAPGRRSARWRRPIQRRSLGSSGPIPATHPPVVAANASTPVVLDPQWTANCRTSSGKLGEAQA